MRTVFLLIFFINTLYAASLSFTVGKSGYHKKELERIVMKKAKERALQECKENKTSTYRIQPVHCSKKEGNQHQKWRCITIVSCFK